MERISSIERKGMERSNRIKVLLMWLFCKYLIYCVYIYYIEFCGYFCWYFVFNLLKDLNIGSSIKWKRKGFVRGES